MTDVAELRNGAEVVAAREAVLELLASTLDGVLPLVTDRGRAEHTTEIAGLCRRIAFLGEAAARLASWPVGDDAAAWSRLTPGLGGPRVV